MALRTPENAERICALLGEGYTLRQVVKEIGVGSKGAIRKWLNEDEEVRDRYARAMELRWDNMAEDLQEISDEGANDWYEREGVQAPDHEHIQRSRLRVDTRKWLLSKMRPRQFGERTTLAGDPDQPLIPPEADHRKLALVLHEIVARAVKGEEEPK